MPIMIDQTTLRDTLSWSQAIDYLEIGLAHEAAGRTDVSHKFNHDFDKGNMRILFAVDYAAGYGATKAYHTIDGIGSRYLVSLIDLTDGGCWPSSTGGRSPTCAPAPPAAWWRARWRSRGRARWWR